MRSSRWPSRWRSYRPPRPSPPTRTTCSWSATTGRARPTWSTPTRSSGSIRLNIIPDGEERLAEINSDPAAAGYFTGINLLIGEGNHQYVDDAFTSLDGRYLYVSRPSFKDVVAFDLATKQIVWRFQVDGYRSDHMAISPDGNTVLVSASTGNVVHAIDTATGKEAWRFESGDSPHENNYSADGNTIFHASIGLVYTPADEPALDSAQGRPLLPDRRRQHPPDPQAGRHGPEARGGRLSRT